MTGLLFPDLPPPDEQPIAADAVVARLRPFAPRILRVAELALAAANHAEQASLAPPHACGFGEMAFATVLYNHTSLKARQEFGADDRFHIHDAQQRFLLCVDGLILQYKKLGRDGMPSHNDTRGATQFVRQILFPDPVITLGVDVSLLRDKVRGIDLICMRDQKREWWRAPLPMSDAGGTPVVPLHPVPTGPSSGGRFKPKGKPEDKDGSGA